MAWCGGTQPCRKSAVFLHNLPQNLYISQGVGGFEGVICLRVDGYRRAVGAALRGDGVHIAPWVGGAEEGNRVLHGANS